jgi:hemolysin D
MVSPQKSPLQDSEDKVLPSAQPNQRSSSSSSSSSRQWSSSLQDVLDQPGPLLPFKLMLGGILFFGLFGAWAWTSQVDDVAVARGKLIPQTEAKKVQHDDTGKVIQLMIKEGDKVQKGQVILELDTEQTQKEVDRLNTLLTASQVELLQTQGMLDRIKLQATNKTKIAGTEVDAQTVSITQNQLAIDNQQRLMAHLRATEIDRQDRLDRFEALEKDGALSKEQILSARDSLRETQRSMLESQGTIDRNLSEIDRLKAGLTQKEAEVDQTSLDGQAQEQQLQIRTGELQAKINETKVLIAKAEGDLKRRYVRASESGEILTLNVRQTGQVIQAGEVIAEIAPEGKPLILSTSLPAKDIGFIKEGMPVKVKMEAFAYQDYGIVSGHVYLIGKDSKAMEQNGQTYRVDVEIDQQSIKAKGENIKFKPGQEGQAEIITRKRRMIEVLFDPLRQMKSDNVNL